MPKSAKPTTTTPLDSGVLSSLIGFNLRMAQLAVYDDFMRGATVSGLTPGQLAILVLIDRNPNTTQQRLSDGIGVEKSTLVVRLHRLAERGLIERVRSTADRRENGLRLTSKGEAALKSMLAFVARHERRIAARLSPSERKQLVTILRKIGTGEQRLGRGDAPKPRRLRRIA
jgi:DNA-binding MarR family transcriptional regulator